MIELLESQAECDAAFRRWVDAMMGGCELGPAGWIHEGSGLVFTNYGHGAPGVVEDEVMLGVDVDTGDATVKIVRPAASKGDKGKLTVAGRDGDGRLVLLREGWLRPNNVSREIRSDFAALSGLTSEPVTVKGTPSRREWFRVADLDGPAEAIVGQTIDLALGCVRARARAGGGKEPPASTKPYSLGLDEKGRVMIVTRRGGTARVRALQGYVYEALRKLLGDALTKPTANGYAVDGMAEAANLLIEIKTGAFAHHCYEGVGQLKLYPSLVGLPAALEPVLLLPDTMALKPVMAGAIREAGVEVYTYSVGGAGAKPRIAFSPAFLARCGVQGAA